MQRSVQTYSYGLHSDESFNSTHTLNLYLVNSPSKDLFDDNLVRFGTAVSAMDVNVKE